MEIKQTIKEYLLLWIINLFVFGANILLINFLEDDEYYKLILSTSKVMEMLIFFLITRFL